MAGAAGVHRPAPRRFRAAAAKLALVLLGMEAGLRLVGALHLLYYARLSPLRREIDDGAYCVMCVGESTTHGHGAEPEESFPAQLEALLRARFPAARVQVFNRGCGR